MPGYDTIIRNGTVVDGSGQIAAYKADVGIRNGKIAAVGGVRGDAKHELDATDCIVAPGFVEIHGHYDHQINWDPWCKPISQHGVTTVSIATCGFGWAPCRPEDHHAYAQNLTRVVSIPSEKLETWLRWDWETFPEWLDSLDRQELGVNVAAMMPLSPLRAYVMGDEEARSRSEMKPEELEKMKALFREAMDAGAWGFSTNKNPEDHHEAGGWLPSHLSSDDEARALAEIVGEYGIGSAYWTLGIGRGEMPLIRELCKLSGRPMTWTGVIQNSSHVDDPWRKALAWSDHNLEMGLPLYAQGILPADFRITLARFNLFDTMPAWVEPMVGSPEERMAKLKVPGVREKMKQDMDGGDHGGDRLFHGEWDRVFVHKVFEERNKQHEGKSIAELAQPTGAHPVDVMLDLAMDENLQTEFFLPYFSGCDDKATAAILKSPSTHPAVSDGGAHYTFTSMANWPTVVLARWSRDKHVLSLEQAHYKISGLPAFIMGYHDRGLLRQGMAADINVYELDKLDWSDMYYINDTPTGDRRLVRDAKGYRYTLVNGQVTFEDGKCTGATPGSLLRSSDYTV